MFIKYNMFSFIKELYVKPGSLQGLQLEIYIIKAKMLTGQPVNPLSFTFCAQCPGTTSYPSITGFNQWYVIKAFRSTH